MEIIIPIDFNIFQRGGPTTNQLWFVSVSGLDPCRSPKSDAAKHPDEPSKIIKAESEAPELDDDLGPPQGSAPSFVCLFTTVSNPP